MLKKEIVSLVSDLEATQKQLEVVERQLEIRKEQDQQLRDNIVVARREVLQLCIPVCFEKLTADVGTTGHGCIACGPAARAIFV